MSLTKIRYKQSNQAFPKAGTPEYQSIQTSNVAYLVEARAVPQGRRRPRPDCEPRRTSTRSRTRRSRALRRQALGLREGAQEGRASRPSSIGRRRSRSRRSRRRSSTPSRRTSTCRIRRSSSTTPQPVAVRFARVARREAHPDRREEQGRLGRLRGQQGEGRRGVRAAEGRRRLRGAREADLRRSGQQGLGREADDLARPDRSRVRQGRVRSQDRRALEAGEDVRTATT